MNVDSETLRSVTTDAVLILSFIWCLGVTVATICCVFAVKGKNKDDDLE